MKKEEASEPKKTWLQRKKEALIRDLKAEANELK